VIARLSAMKYKHTDKSIDQIGKELGVKYVLESSVRRSSERVRITSQLIDVTDQNHVWAQSFDRDLKDVLAVQEEIAHSIAGEVHVTQGTSGEVLFASPSVDRETHEEYLKGIYFLHKHTPAEWRKGKEYLESAMKRDPQYAPAYAGLA
jgi:hypothetical protein